MIKYYHFTLITFFFLANPLHSAQAFAASACEESILKQFKMTEASLTTAYANLPTFGSKECTTLLSSSAAGNCTLPRAAGSSYFPNIPGAYTCSTNGHPNPIMSKMIKVILAPYYYYTSQVDCLTKDFSTHKKESSRTCAVQYFDFWASHHSIETGKAWRYNYQDTLNLILNSYYRILSNISLTVGQKANITSWFNAIGTTFLKDPKTPFLPNKGGNNVTLMKAKNLLRIGIISGSNTLLDAAITHEQNNLRISTGSVDPTGTYFLGDISRGTMALGYTSSSLYWLMAIAGLAKSYLNLNFYTYNGSQLCTLVSDWNKDFSSGSPNFKALVLKYNPNLSPSTKFSPGKAISVAGTPCAGM